LAHKSWVQAVAFSPDGKLLATASADAVAKISELAPGGEISRLAYHDTNRTQWRPNARAEKSPDRILSPDGTYSVTQNDNWLRLYQRAGKDNWRPIANRFLPVIIPNTVSFPPASAHCPRCVEFVRDVPGDPTKLERVNFDEYPSPIKGDPKRLVAEWSAKLGLKFDERGHIVPLQP